MLLTPLNRDSDSNAVGTSVSNKKTSKEAQVLPLLSLYDAPFNFSNRNQNVSRSTTMR